MANESGNTDIETGVNLGQEPDQVAVAVTSSVDRGKKGKATTHIEEEEEIKQKATIHLHNKMYSYIAKDKPTLSRRSSKITDKSVTIYRVPEAMRQSGEKENLYEPTCINVYNPLWKGENEHYYFHLSSFTEKSNKGLWDYMRMMEEQEGEIAKRNEEKISTDESHLLGLLLSSCFILDLFIKYCEGKLSPADDPECGHRWVYDLWVDLLLVENQIPFFILEKVYKIAYNKRNRFPLQRLAFYFFDQFVPMIPGKFKDGPSEDGPSEDEDGLSVLKMGRLKMGRKSENWWRDEDGSSASEYGPSEVKMGRESKNGPSEVKMGRESEDGSSESEDGPSEVYHLLHLVHHSLIPSDPGRHKRLKRKNCILYSLWETMSKWLGREMQLPMDVEGFDRLSKMRTIPTATRLQQAGVKFRTREDRGFVVEFNNGVLELAHLHVRTTTKKFLMNLIAWEQCHRGAEKYFTNYAIFMYYLVNTSKDLEILIESGVLEHSLKNNEEVVQVFNSLSDNLVYAKLKSYDFLPKLCVELNRYSESRFNKWRAKLMTDYFGSPWTTISLIAAALIVLLTMLQTFFSVYSYFRPPQQK